jgi:hypothetical protein
MKAIITLVAIFLSFLWINNLTDRLIEWQREEKRFREATEYSERIRATYKYCPKCGFYINIKKAEKRNMCTVCLGRVE